MEKYLHFEAISSPDIFIIDCPKCHGRGIVTLGDRTSRSKLRCPCCNGEKEILVKKVKKV